MSSTSSGRIYRRSRFENRRWRTYLSTKPGTAFGNLNRKGGHDVAISSLSFVNVARDYSLLPAAESSCGSASDAVGILAGHRFGNRLVVSRWNHGVERRIPGIFLPRFASDDFAVHVDFLDDLDH